MDNYHKRNKEIRENGDEQMQDLYETDPVQVERLLDYLPLVPNMTFFECCNGNGAISNVLKQRGFRVIERDLFIPNERGEVFDYLKDPLPSDYDMTISNPPYANKGKFIERAFGSGKPFIFLLPLKTLNLKVMKEFAKTHGLYVFMPSEPAKFFRNGEWVKPEDVAWFVGNEEHISAGRVEIFYM